MRSYLKFRFFIFILAFLIIYNPIFAEKIISVKSRKVINNENKKVIKKTYNPLTDYNPEVDTCTIEKYNNGFPMKIIGYNSSDGKVKEFWFSEQGLLTRLYLFKNGKLHGKSIHYFIDGTVANESFYLNDIGEGKWVGWYTNRKKRYEENYKNGMRHGEIKAWYDDGTLHYKTIFENGTGQIITKRRNGQMVQIRQYKKGKPTGEWIIYDEKGNIKSSKSYD